MSELVSNHIHNIYKVCISFWPQSVSVHHDQAAFDSITPEHIRKSLLKHGCNHNMVEWYYELLKHRNLITTYDNFKLLLSTGLGFPQGGVCSAKFWIIAFNDAAEILNTHGVSGELFSDDGNGIIGGNDIIHMATKLN